MLSWHDADSIFFLPFTYYKADCDVFAVHGFGHILIVNLSFLSCSALLLDHNQQYKLM